MKLHDTEIEKYIFHQSKRAISINNKIDIDKIVLSDRASSGKNISKWNKNHKFTSKSWFKRIK